jgi:hypothetical protein
MSAENESPLKSGRKGFGPMSLVPVASTGAPT